MLRFEGGLPQQNNLQMWHVICPCAISWHYRKPEISSRYGRKIAQSLPLHSHPPAILSREVCLTGALMSSTFCRQASCSQDVRGEANRDVTLTGCSESTSSNAAERSSQHQQRTSMMGIAAALYQPHALSSSKRQLFIHNYPTPLMHIGDALT